MQFIIRILAFIAIGSALLEASVAAAQDSIPSHLRSIDADRLLELGGHADARLRTAQIFGESSSAGYLIRTPSSGERAADGERKGLDLLLPRFEVVRNSAIPLSMNDGALWAGAGTNIRLSAGVRILSPHFRLVLAPEVLRVENRPIRHLVRSERVGWSLYASPWDRGGASIDLPLRFGELSYLQWDPGQSMAELATAGIAIGVSTENEWWGPGIRNALVMSNNAGGIPRAYMGTSHPWRTPVGELEGRWIAGWLTESLFADSNPENDRRSLNGIVTTLRPATAPNLTLGVARVMYADASDKVDPLLRAFDVLTRPGARASDSIAADETVPPDQIISLFARWIFPPAGAEAYVEWARQELPTGLRDLLVSPEHSQGYTLGLQWARPIRELILRLQGEVTYLEMSSTFQQRPVTTFYTSRSTVQGYTQRGQVIGAAIGPGASSQFFAMDLLGREWEVGLLGQRIRWDNDAFYTRPWGYSHDVSMIAGVRAAGSLRLGEAAIEILRENRMNYLFQDRTSGFGGADATDVSNWQFRLSINP